MVMANGFPTDADRAMQVFREMSYGEWREYDPMDTLRFYSLRLHELGLIETAPTELIDTSTNWRFVNELKAELKA